MLSRVCHLLSVYPSSYRFPSSYTQMATSLKRWSSRVGRVVFNQSRQRVNHLPRRVPVVPRTVPPCTLLYPPPTHLGAIVTPIPPSHRTSKTNSKCFVSDPTPPEGTLANPVVYIFSVPPCPPSPRFSVKSHHRLSTQRSVSNTETTFGIRDP
jgi:hypothetical protein